MFVFGFAMFALCNFFKLKKYIDKIPSFYDEYILDEDKYITNREFNEFIKKYEWIYEGTSGINIYWKCIKEFRFSYYSLLSRGDELRRSHNNQFINEELKRFDECFSDVDNKSLDNQQRVACVVDDDYNLVIAGAGSGKTLTICGKIKYLLEKGINPDRILCISFTNKACDELKERFNRVFGLNIDVETFHKLALSIIDECGEKCEIADENKCNQFLEEAFNGIRTKDAIVSQMKAMVYSNMYLIQHGGESLKDKHVSIKDIVEHIKSVNELKQYERIGKSLESMCYEIMKSEYEVGIANFLFLNGIDYEYEAKYIVRDKSKAGEYFSNNIYHPDFYLPKYDVYIEHFGIDESGRASWLEDEEKIEEYSLHMEEKKKLHQNQGTKLICTYSYEKDNLLELLHERLSEVGVEFKPITNEVIDLFNKTCDYGDSFVKLISAFIKLFKNRNYDLSQFDKLPIIYSANHYERYVLKLIKHIYIKYQNFLKENNMLDFEDMIIKANALFEEYEIEDKYDYIIVDEYQDVSIGKVDLLKNLISLNNAKLLCVGDDWQSIYRFAGSEVSMITSFDKIFTKPMIMKIENTYRNSKKLIEVGSQFIQKNPIQINKTLESNKTCLHPIVIKGYANKIVVIPRELEDKGRISELITESLEDSRYPVLLSVLDEMYDENTNKEVLLLVRNNFDLTIINYWLGNNKCPFKPIKNIENQMKFEYKNMIIKCMTIHKSKGLEADDVILFDIKEGLRGLPDLLGDDKFLRFVLATQEGIDYAEDRRLFYVALTRTKNRVYIISSARTPSSFVEEISKCKGIESNLKDLICPECRSYLAKHKEVYLCSNLQCKFKIKAKDDIELIDKIKTYRLKKLKMYKRF